MQSKNEVYLDEQVREERSEDSPRSYSSEEKMAILSKLNLATPIASIFLEDLVEHVQTHFGRYQLIVHNGGHSTAVDVINSPVPVMNNPEDVINKKSVTKSCVIMDAVGDPRMNPIAGCFQKLGFERIIMPDRGHFLGSIQYDAYSCESFSFDHCVQASLESDDFHDRLDEGSKNKCIVAAWGNCALIPWADFPPNFVWNAQSFRFLNGYKAQMTQQGKGALLEEKRGLENLSFNEYIQRGTRKVLDKDSVLKDRNMSISDFVFYVKEAYAHGAQDDDDISEVFDVCSLDDDDFLPYDGPQAPDSISQCRAIKAEILEIKNKDPIPLEQNEEDASLSDTHHPKKSG